MRKRRALFALLPLLVIAAACGTGAPSSGGADASTPEGASAEASSDAPSSDADDGSAGCVVDTCHGKVTLQLGQSVPLGDRCCQVVCTFTINGMLRHCGCDWQSDCCGCPDAGADASAD